MLNQKITIEYFEIKHFEQNLVFTGKIIINDSHLFANFNNYDQNYRYTNQQPKAYYRRYFKDVCINTAREILKQIQNENSPTFKQMFENNDCKIENLYFILGEHNDYGIIDWIVKEASEIEMIFQVECYYNFNHFVNISGSLAHSNVAIYSNVINNPKYLKKQLHPNRSEAYAIHNSNP